MIQIDSAIPFVDVELYKTMVHVFTKRKQLKKLESDNPSLPLDLIKELDYGADSVITICGTNVLMYIGTQSPGIICHESCHAADMILENVGIPLSMDNTEARAYLTEFIFNRVCGVLGIVYANNS